MTEQAPSELERDAERIRAELADTAEHLKEKMSPGQLMDEVVDYFKDGDTNQLITNLKHQVRDNPLALALVGSGLAWLMMGSGPGSRANGATARPKRHPGEASAIRAAGGTSAGASPEASPSRQVSGSSGTASSLSNSAAEVRDAASDAAGTVGEAVRSATDSVSAALHDVRDSASDSFSYAAEAGANLGERAKSTFLEALEREPLVIGALGVAVGAAIGAMLPATRAETEYLGAASAKARGSVESAVSEGIEKARHVAQDVYSAARDEADKQGLTASSKPVAEKVADVGKAAANELKRTAEDTIHQAEEAADKKTDTVSPAPRQDT